MIGGELFICIEMEGRSNFYKKEKFYFYYFFEFSFYKWKKSKDFFSLNIEIFNWSEPLLLERGKVDTKISIVFFLIPKYVFGVKMAHGYNYEKKKIKNLE